MDLPLFFTLPLIGGFAFVTGCFPLRWRSARQDAQRLYYRAAVWGAVLTLATASLHGLLLLWPAYVHGFEWLNAQFLHPLLTGKDPLPAPSLAIRAHVALICVYALMFGVSAQLWGKALLWAGSRFDTGLPVRVNLSAITDPLESLLARSLLSGEAIQVTLSTGKMYVGYVLILPLHIRTRPIRNVAPVVRVERGVTAQPVAA